MSDDFSIVSFENYRTVAGQYSDDFIKSSLAVKVSESEKDVTVCISTRSRSNLTEVLSAFHKGKKLNIILSEAENFAEFVGKYVEKDEKKSAIKPIKTDIKLLDVSKKERVINIVNGLCLTALRLNASDIHIQNQNGECFVRYRIDGVLQNFEVITGVEYDKIISRIKFMAKIDVAERHKPLDGRIRAEIQDDFFDARVSVIPSFAGDTVVMRLFEKNTESLSLNNLGFSDDIYKMLCKAITLKSGLVLATGPTGCGKTTTLHAILNQMDKDTQKIITIEDPVERVVKGVDQIQAEESGNFSFANILRSVLRQDPDVIMIGEIRDSETAALAVRAAVTGHLVLSTLHTESAVSAITRMTDLGVEYYMLSSVLKYCLSQRLVRKITTDESGEKKYKGRIAVGEMFAVSEKIREAIDRKGSIWEIEKLLKTEGFKSIRDNASDLVNNGETDWEELNRAGIVE